MDLTNWLAVDLCFDWLAIYYKKSCTSWKNQNLYSCFAHSNSKIVFLNFKYYFDDFMVNTFDLS